MLESLELKNAIGIKNGHLNKEHIKIEFTKLFPNGGLIALLGANGYGKTTILGSCHPFKRTISDAIKFKDLFVDQTGEKTVVYNFDGDIYTFTLKVNKGLVKGIVLKNGVPLNEEGRAKEYDYVVKKMFGESKTFFKTSFKGAQETSLCSLSKIDLKKHYIQVLGLEEYKEMNDKIITKHLKRLNKLIDDEQKNIELIESKLVDKSEIKLKTILESRQEAYNGVQKKIIQISSKINEIQKEHDKINNNKSDIQVIHEEITLISKNILELTNELNNLQNELTQLELKDKALNDECVLFGKEIRDLNELKVENEKLLNDKDKIEKEKTTKDILQLKINDLRIQSDHLVQQDFEYLSLKKEKERIESEIIRIDNRLHNKSDNPFTVCNSCPLANEIEELQNEQLSLQNKLNDLEFINKLENLKIESEKYHETKKDLEQANKELRVFVNTDEKWKKIVKYKDELINTTWKLNRITYNFQTAKASIISNEAIKLEKIKAITSLQKNIDELTTKITEKENQIKSLEVVIDDKDLKFFKEELKIQEHEAKILNENIIKVSIDLEYVQRDHAEKAKHVKKLNELHYEKEGWEIAAFTFNEKNGLPFIELKNACPVLEDLANNLVSTIWPTFSFKFLNSKMQKLKGKKTTEEIDYFDIIIERPGKIDASISVLSGGEAAVADACLSLAVVIYMKISSGYKIDTLMLDESDKALSPLNKSLFFNLIDKAHREAGCKQTIFVTHSDSLPPTSMIVLDEKSPSGYTHE